MKKITILSLLIILTGCTKTCEDGFTYNKDTKLCEFKEELKAIKNEECTKSEGFKLTKKGSVCYYEKDGTTYQTNAKVTYSCPSLDYELKGDKCVYEKTKKAK